MSRSIRLLLPAVLLAVSTFAAAQSGPKAGSEASLTEQCRSAAGKMGDNCAVVCASVPDSARADCVKSHGGDPGAKPVPVRAPSTRELARDACGSTAAARRESCVATCGGMPADAIKDCVRAHGGA